MTDIISLNEHQWPSGDSAWLVSLNVRLETIAAEHSFELRLWDEPGLGPVRGLLARTDSGRVFLLAQYDHAMEHLGSKGPDISVDMQELVANGVETLVAEVLEALGMSTQHVEATQSSVGVRWVTDVLAARRQGRPLPDPTDYA